MVDCISYPDRNILVKMSGERHSCDSRNLATTAAKIKIESHWLNCSVQHSHLLCGYPGFNFINICWTKSTRKNAEDYHLLVFEKSEQFL
jgi:hypothetical protein